MTSAQKGSILVAIDALTRALAFDNAEHGVRLAQTQLASTFPRVDERRIVVADEEAATIVLRYTPSVEGVNDPEVARSLWRDALDREADMLAKRHGAEVELHFEDLLARDEQ